MLCRRRSCCIFVDDGLMDGPAHAQKPYKFAEPDAVMSTVMQYAPHDGIYVIPSCDSAQKGDKMRPEPFLFVNLRRDVVMGSMVEPIIMSIITQMVGAFLITYLLLQAKAMKYWNRVWFVTVAGIAVAVIGLTPAGNWWHFPLPWVILEMFDMAVAWFLGGLVISKLVKG